MSHTRTSILLPPRPVPVPVKTKSNSIWYPRKNPYQHFLWKELEFLSIKIVNLEKVWKMNMFLLINLVEVILKVILLFLMVMEAVKLLNTFRRIFTRYVPRPLDDFTETFPLVNGDVSVWNRVKIFFQFFCLKNLRKIKEMNRNFPSNNSMKICYYYFLFTFLLLFFVIFIYFNILIFII